MKIENNIRFYKKDNDLDYGPDYMMYVMDEDTAHCLTLLPIKPTKSWRAAPGQLHLFTVKFDGQKPSYYDFAFDWCLNARSGDSILMDDLLFGNL